MTQKHDDSQGHHNPSNPQSTASVDCKLSTVKDESFSSEAVKNEDIYRYHGGVGDNDRI